MVSKETKKILRYNAIFEPCEEGGFVVTVPKLPGVVTEGDTFEEAVENVKDAVKGYLQVLVEANETIPDPDNKTVTATVDIDWSEGKFVAV